MTEIIDTVETANEFDCPWCHCKITAEYTPFETKLTEVGKDFVLVCKSCGEDYDLHVVQAMQNRLTHDRAKTLGVTVEAYKAMQEEQKYWQKYDEDNIDDEVDLKDVNKANKIFKDKRDPHEQSKTPIQIMKERFEAGLRKERERKIVVPMRRRLKTGGR